MTLSVFSYKKLYQAYLDCRKNKRNKIDALKFEINAEENLYILLQELLKGTYHPSSSRCFVTIKPKLREIIAADFRDRIVHHLLVRHLEKDFEPVFIHNSFASRKGKGTHLGVKQLTRYMGKVTKNNKIPAYYMQLDIRNFFMEINRNILYLLIKKKCEINEMRWLAKVIIFNDPTSNVLITSPKERIRKVPEHKSLFGRDQNFGLPIGNLTSQFFANVYLNQLDQYVKHKLKCRFYLRYVDDFILLDTDLKLLRQWQDKISKFLSTRLQLSFNPSRTRLQPVSNGADFLGYVIRPDYTLCRRRVVNNLREKLRALKKEMICIKHGKFCLDYSSSTTVYLFDMLNSYFSHFHHANSFKLIQGIFRENAWISHYFNYENKKLIRRYTPKACTSLKRQYYFFTKQFPKELIFFQAGCFFEFFSRQAEFAAGFFGLKKIKPKFGFKLRCGIGKNYIKPYIIRAVKSGYPVAVIEQTGYQGNYVVERIIKERYVARI
jgi:RNA-directed DNA polymerase